ncbi:MAG: Rid family hydrolase [Stackebrandtia sp.]
MTQVRRVGSGGPWEQLYGYSRAVAAGPLTVTSGSTAMVDGKPAHPGDPGAQAKEAFRVALDGLVDAGAGIADVIRTRMYVTDASYADPVGRVHGELFGVVKPAATLVVVAGLIHPDLLVEVELEAYRPPRD